MSEPSKVLIDTGAWVDFLASKEGQLGSAVALLIERDQAVICGVIIAELMQGAVDAQQQTQLNFLFQHIHSLPMTESVMIKAGELSQKIRLAGHSIPLTDAVIAAVALEQDVAVLTADQNFTHFKGVRLIK